jgi:hypothetical protein
MKTAQLAHASAPDRDAFGAAARGRGPTAGRLGPNRWLEIGAAGAAAATRLVVIARRPTQGGARAAFLALRSTHQR